MPFSADFLYWLGSTVAQSVVALIAFGAFIGVWRRDSIWQSISRHLDDLADACELDSVERSMMLGNIHGDRPELSDWLGAMGATEIHNKAVPRVAEYRHATDPDAQLEALIGASEPWLAIELSDEPPEDSEVWTLWHEIQTIQKLHPQLVTGRRTLAKIRAALKLLSWAGLGAFVLSLAVIAVAEPATVERATPVAEVAGFAVLVLLVIATVLSLVAAGRLARASFGETDAPGDIPVT